MVIKANIHSYLEAIEVTYVCLILYYLYHYMYAYVRLLRRKRSIYANLLEFNWSNFEIIILENDGEYLATCKK